MSRALGWMVGGLLLAALVVAAITPVGAFALDAVLPLLGIIVVGIVIVVVAGFRGERADRDRRSLLEHRADSEES